MAAEYQRYRVPWPLVPAMAMVMIDFTIVSISVTTIQRDLGLSEAAAQWTVTADTARRRTSRRQKATRIAA